jgi:UDP-2-acetamido-3-amino-2,3-dideoxy-glucuronate N-acetyltransferase
MNSGLILLDGIRDERGLLVALESNKNIPFDVKRVYYLTDLKSMEPRGFHAHKNLNQLAVCIRGECRFILDNGFEKKMYHLDNPTTGLLIGSLVWREMDQFSDDCLILVLASELYDENDYIRDYEIFKKEVSK